MVNIRLQATRGGSSVQVRDLSVQSSLAGLLDFAQCFSGELGRAPEKALWFA